MTEFMFPTSQGSLSWRHQYKGKSMYFLLFTKTDIEEKYMNGIVKWSLFLEEDKQKLADFVLIIILFFLGLLK